LEVFTAEYTLEADLAGETDNLPLLKVLYLEQHPLSVAKWSAIETAAHPAKAFHDKLRSDEKFIRKGEFAQSLAVKLEGKVVFKCPSYLDLAIHAATEVVLVADTTPKPATK